MSKFTSYRLVFRKYVFDNDIDYLEQPTQFTEQRFTSAMATALAVARFYKKNRDEDVMEKDTLTVLAQMAKRNVYTAELEEVSPSTGIHKNEIIATSMVSDFYFPININGNLKTQVFLEAGGMRCLLNGFNIQKIMNAIRLIDNLSNEPNCFYFCATYGDAKDSPRNLNKMGFSESENIYEELKEYRKYQIGSEINRGIRFFRPNLLLIKSFCKIITQLKNAPIVARNMRKDKNYYLPDIKTAEVIFDRGINPSIFTISEEIISKSPTSFNSLIRLIGASKDSQFLER